MSAAVCLPQETAARLGAVEAYWQLLICSVCGGTEFQGSAILWDELTSQWQLSPLERGYIDRQQGTKCVRCGANLRSIALANAIRNALGTTDTLQSLMSANSNSNLSLLEINEAGSLSPALRLLPRHVFAAYPAIDIHALPYPDGQFDLVVHSDTLEHVSQPIRALAECRRVLRQGGHLCYTVPTIVGRMTRSRTGLEKSFHGDPTVSADDFLVHTEYGADMWTAVLLAGFDSVTITAVEYPAGLALSARKAAS